MTTVVCFEAGGDAYCLPVESTRGVRRADGIVSLPAPRADVAGIVAGDPPLTVIATLGRSRRGSGQILVIETADKTFGLLVDAVTGLRRIDPSRVNDAPDGQAEQPLVSGTIDVDGRLLLIADADAIGARL